MDCPNLESFRLERDNAQLVPILFNKLLNFQNLKCFCLKEKIENNTNSRDSYLSDENFSIVLEIPNPKQLKFVLDYDYYHFNLDQFVKVTTENDFSEFQADIDTLIKSTQHADEL